MLPDIHRATQKFYIFLIVYLTGCTPEQVGIANVNLSKIKTGKVSAIRFSTLNAICKALDCQPGDILEYQEDED